MPYSAAKFVSAIFASALAGAALAAVSHVEPARADDCLAAPKSDTPEGSHWYYRIDRATKRHCWYLRDEDGKLSQATPPDSSLAAKPAAPAAAVSMQRSLADARAELPAQTSIEPAARNNGMAPAMPANASAGEGNTPGADTRPSVVASRWPDPSAVRPAAGPQPAMEQMAANAQAEPQPDPAQSDPSPSDPAQSSSAAAPPPAAAAVPLAAADSSQGLPASLAMLLAVMTGALGLAGITASIVLKFGRARRTVRVSRDRIWDSADRDRIRARARLDSEVVPRRPHFPRDLDQAAEPADRVADFYAKISKQARG